MHTCKQNTHTQKIKIKPDMVAYALNPSTQKEAVVCEIVQPGPGQPKLHNETLAPQKKEKKKKKKKKRKEKEGEGGREEGRKKKKGKEKGRKEGRKKLGKDACKVVVRWSVRCLFITKAKAERRTGSLDVEMEAPLPLGSRGWPIRSSRTALAT
jgi:flagellar biosynthesis/type III secretory pathway protein FliH